MRAQAWRSGWEQPLFRRATSVASIRIIDEGEHMAIVTSREYKIVLKTAAFSDREKAQKDLWLAVQAITNELQIQIKGFMNERLVRKVKFFDTPNRDFNTQGYALRIRESMKNGQPERTKAMLKFRSPDRVISGGVDVSSPLKTGMTKFEEDILTPFRSQYAKSTSVEIADSNWQTIANITQVFPGINSLGLNPSTPVAVTNGFVATETVTRGAIIALGKDEAAAAIVLWDVADAVGGDKLAIAELSFAYGNATGEFSSKSAIRAKNLFEKLQTLTEWSDPNGTTKTKFAYTFNAP